MIRLSWVQPEDLVAHELRAAADEGKDVSGFAARWARAGGSTEPAETGASPDPVPATVRAVARELLAELDLIPVPPALAAAEPNELAAIEELCTAGSSGRSTITVDAVTLPSGVGKLDAPHDRVHGAWLGRAAGCLLGKPVEKIPRAGIRAILESSRNWPLTQYFTAKGLAPEVARRYPWNRKSAGTSLRENIDGMPEDDDMNFALIALRLLEAHGGRFSTDDVANSWLADLPAGRVFTAERIAYRNLLDGIEPDRAGSVGNPFREWIGAQIRTDVYGWVNPGDPRAAARLAWQDARLTHARSGLYGAMFIAAACSTAVVATGEDRIDRVLDAGLSVIPPASRFAEAVAFGRELGASALDDETAIDRIHDRYGRLHWVHSLNNSCLLAFSLVRGAGDFGRTIALAVVGGWDTDSVGASAGSIAGALIGARGLPDAWVDPLRNRLATSIPGLDGIGFDELADRTRAVAAARP